MAKKNSDFIDIRALVTDWLRHWPWFIVSVALFVGLGLLYIKASKPKYAVRANVLIAQEGSNPLSAMGGGEMASLGALFGAKGAVDDEYYLLTSHSVYRDAVKALGLNRKFFVKKGFLNTVEEFEEIPIEVECDPAMFDTLKVAIGFRIKAKADRSAVVTIRAKKEKIVNKEHVKLPHTFNTEYGTFTLTPTEYFPKEDGVNTYITLRGYHHAAEDLAKDLNSSIASKRANVISLGINTPYPDYGEAVVNEVVAQYNNRGIEDMNQQALKTHEFLNERLALLSGDLATAESEIQNYKEHQGLIDVEVEAKYQTEKRSAIEQSLIQAEVQTEMLKYTVDFIKNTRNSAELIPAPAVENDGLAKAITAFNELVLRRMQLAENAKPGNVTLRRLDEQIEAMRANVLASARRAYETSSTTAADLRAKLNSTMGRLGSVPRQEREFIDKERQREIKQQIYLFLLERQEETAIMLSNTTPKGIIVDEAYTLNEPLGMGSKTILAICLLMGLCMPPVALYLRRYLRNRVESRQDVERISDVPILGEVSISNSGKHLVIDSAETSSTAELFRLLRSNLLFVLTPPSEKVVIVTSATPGDGKSFISINLAASLSLLGKKVALVGMDIRSPRLAQYLDMHPRFGVTQYLASPDMSVNNLISTVDSLPNLDLIAAGPVPPNPGELVTSPRVAELFEELRKRYDFIIIDSAPVGRVSDTYALNDIADACIFVCRVGNTSLDDIEMADEIRNQHRLKKLSIVVNGTPARRAYGYGQSAK